MLINEATKLVAELRDTVARIDATVLLTSVPSTIFGVPLADRFREIANTLERVATVAAGGANDADELLTKINEHVMLAPCDEYTRAYTRELLELLRLARDELTEQQLSFDLRWRASKRARERWQALHPGKENVWPDHADLCVWLMAQWDAIPETVHEVTLSIPPDIADSPLAQEKVRREFQASLDLAYQAGAKSQLVVRTGVKL